MTASTTILKASPVKIRLSQSFVEARHNYHIHTEHVNTMISVAMETLVRRLLSEGKLSQRKIARATGVSRATITAISTGRRPAFLGERVEERAGEIIVLGGGRLVERGPHAELLARGGRYAGRWRLQQSGRDA